MKATLKLILLIFSIINFKDVYSQNIIDTRGLPNPPEGCEISLSVDTLDKDN